MAECKKIEIVVRGDTEAALEMAFEEAVQRIQAGCTSGSDRNQESGFYFDVDESVPAGEWPR